MVKTYKPTQGEIIEKYLLNRLKTCSTKNLQMQEVLEHHFYSGGSRTRAKLAFIFSKNLGIDDDICFLISCIPEFFHNASLIHDDLQDGDEYRREELAVWKKYGSNVAICAGDFLISEAYACLADIPKEKLNPELIRHIGENISILINGQMKDLSQDNEQTLSSLETYEDIASGKSGPLLALTLTIPLIISGKSELVKTAQTIFNHYALAYQILDDLSDIELDQSKKGEVSGVNIVTVLQMKDDINPYETAVNIGKNHLKDAKKLCDFMPKSCQEILLKEINRLQIEFEK